MIAPDVVGRIECLLLEGRLSQSKIAECTGVSRTSVGAINCGKRRVGLNPDRLASPSGPVVRCGGCGGRVLAPCLLCQVRAWQHKRKTQAARVAR
jgi:hypothetical protein